MFKKIILLILTMFVFMSNAQASTLTVSKDGTGSGTVYSLPWIECGSTCVADFYDYFPMSVMLTAVADSESTFVGWSGDCRGDLDCSIVIEPYTLYY